MTERGQARTDWAAMNEVSGSVPGYERRLAEILSRIASVKPQPIMACVNADRTNLPTFSNGAEFPQPNIAHQLVQCFWCGEDCWFGQYQAALGRDLGRDIGLKMCVACVYTMKLAGLLPRSAVVALTVGEDPTPRRT